MQELITKFIKNLKRVGCQLGEMAWNDGSVAQWFGVSFLRQS